MPLLTELQFFNRFCSTKIPPLTGLVRAEAKRLGPGLRLRLSSRLRRGGFLVLKTLAAGEHGRTLMFRQSADLERNSANIHPTASVVLIWLCLQRPYVFSGGSGSSPDPSTGMGTRGGLSPRQA